MTLWQRFLTALLGPHCETGCGQRVYPKDRAEHQANEHAGDRIDGAAT